MGSSWNIQCISQTSGNFGRTVAAKLHTDWLYSIWLLSGHILEQTYTLSLSLWSSFSCPGAAKQQCCPQFFFLTKTAKLPNLTYHPLATTQCVICVFFFGCATASLCPAVAHLGATGQSHADNNVFSVFPELMSVKTLFMTHTTYTPCSAWKYHSFTRAHTHTQYYTVKNDCASEQGEF